MDIKYPKDNPHEIISYEIGDGYTSPFDVKHLKKSATAVKKANNALKKRKAERFTVNKGAALRDKPRGKQVAASLKEVYEAANIVFDCEPSKSAKGATLSRKKVSKALVKELEKAI